MWSPVNQAETQVAVVGGGGQEALEKLIAKLWIMVSKSGWAEVRQVEGRCFRSRVSESHKLLQNTGV